MAAYLYLARPEQLSQPVRDVPPILLDGGAAYWFLYRYFEAANLNRENELIDLYGGAVIDGYQLHRLKSELEQALQDIEVKPARWKVLIGWNGEQPTQETEDWREVDRSELFQTVTAILALVRGASSELKLVCSGD